MTRKQRRLDLDQGLQKGRIIAGNAA